MKPLLDSRYDDFVEYTAFRESQKRVVEGTIAPEFTLKDRDGKPVSLTDITTEWVVLDFWGSWCGPCIEGFPAMKRSYERLKGKVEFVGLACSDRRADWLAALDRDRRIVKIFRGEGEDFYNFLDNI